MAKEFTCGDGTAGKGPTTTISCTKRGAVWLKSVFFIVPPSYQGPTHRIYIYIYICVCVYNYIYRYLNACKQDNYTNAGGLENVLFFHIIGNLNTHPN